MSRFSHTKPAAMKPPSLIGTVLLLIGTLIALGAGGFMAFKSFKVVTQWEKADGKVVSIQETTSVDKYGNKKTNYRPTFEVKTADGAKVQVRNFYAYDSTSGIEMGSTVAIRYQGSEAMLNTVGSLYVVPVAALSIGAFLAAIFYVTNKGRTVALEHNKKHGY